MPNRRRGEIEAVFDGRPHTLCLTLGALAELEAAFAVDDMTALAERFERGRVSARDAIAILGAGLRGGGTAASTAEVAALRIDGGAVGAVRAVAELLAATFGGDDGQPSAGAPPARPRPARDADLAAPAPPFPGKGEADASAPAPPFPGTR